MCEVVHTQRKKFMSKIFAPGVPARRNNHLDCAEIGCECLAVHPTEPLGLQSGNGRIGA